MGYYINVVHSMIDNGTYHKWEHSGKPIPVLIASIIYNGDAIHVIFNMGYIVILFCYINHIIHYHLVTYICIV